MSCWTKLVEFQGSKQISWSRNISAIQSILARTATYSSNPCRRHISRSTWTLFCTWWTRQPEEWHHVIRFVFPVRKQANQRRQICCLRQIQTDPAFAVYQWPQWHAAFLPGV